MKPSFALNLTEEGVTLLHRTARGWIDVGHVAFSDPDLPAALDYLRSTAMGLSPKGLTAKVVIPNSQILYTRVSAPGPGREAQRTQIAAALEGRTPYAVEDLIFDWSGEGEDVNVAVVARETLDEAEGFASEHRFNPVSFVAIPDDGFDREPFFGPSRLAETLLTEGQSVEPDHELIQLVARDLPRAEPQPEPEPAPEQPAPERAPDTMPEPTQAPIDLAASEPDAAPEPEPEPEWQAAPAPMAEVAAEPAEKALEAPAVETASPPEPEPVNVTPPVAQPPMVEAPAPPPAEKARSDFSAPARPAKTAQAAPSLSAGDEAPMAVDVPLEDEPPAAPPRVAVRSASVTAPVTPTGDEDLPPPLSNAALMAFASRRTADAPAPAAQQRKITPAINGAAVDADSGAPALGAASAGNRGAAKAPTVERPAGAKPPPKFSYDDPVPPPPRLPGDPPTAQGVIAAKAGKGLKNLGNLVTAPTIAGPKVRKPAVVARAQTINPSEGVQTGVSPDALAKGLGARARPQVGKPKYLGLILTGILLLMLAVVAAWSSLYLTQSSPTDEAPATAALGDTSVPQTASVTDDEAVIPSIADEAAADGEEAVSDAPLPAATDEAPPPAAQDAATLVAEEPAQPSADTAGAEEAGAAQAASQAAEPAPAEPAPRTGLDAELTEAGAPAGDEQDEIFLAGMDAAPNATDPMALAPPANRADALPGAPMPPPPFGTVYQFDADGRIVPTPEGIETPEGVLLVAGKPSILPPPRPEAVTAAALAAAPTDTPPPAEAASIPAEPAVADGALTPAETFAADPALADTRPRSRPEGLAPTTAPAAGEDDASLAPAEDSRFASLRPRLRPAEILAAGENSRRAAEAASLAAQAAVAAATEAAVAEANADGSISPMAVAVSRVPAPRPRDLSRAVEAAVAAASQPAARAKAADPEPAPGNEEADEEPETASAAPRIPTKASVAKQATYVNAINLSKVNLIGVYGTQSKRYALIRQSNGRYKKVRVGDNFDGGTVKAITTSEVRYQKGGRLVTLAMPRG